jgi:hypothetical protein
VSGPAWIGIGAQRSGTTWFTGLLLQHPGFNLGRSDEKELHFFDRFMIDEPTERERREYVESFDRPCSGEFTPGYMRWLWVPRLVHETCGTEITILVLLRDPIERFASAIRWYLDRRERKQPGATSGGRWLKDKGTDAIWGGMYASQLRAWTATFPRSRFVVEQYERAVDDPQGAVSRVWSRLGLPDHRVEPTSELTLKPTTTEPEPRFAELHDHLRSAYRSEVDELVHEWGIDVSIWPNFAR